MIAPSVSLSVVETGETGEYVARLATQRLQELGLTVSFGEHAREADEFSTSSIESRVADLNAAFADPNVHGVMTAIGGFNSNELLPFIDFDLIAQNPKFFCGYSDISFVQTPYWQRPD